MRQFEVERVIQLLHTSEQIQAINDWSAFSCLKVAENIANNILILPNGTTISLNNQTPAWDTCFSNNRNSNYLWLYSLNYVGSLCLAAEKSKNSNYYEIAKKIFINFAEESNKNNNLKDIIFSLNKSGGSIDHSISLRTNAFVKLISNLKFEELATETQYNLAVTLCDSINWMYNDSNYSDNNHGTMVDICLVQVGKLFGEKSTEGKALIKKASERIENGIKSRFDCDGLANENTIGYHRYNITLFQSAASMLANTLEGSLALKKINNILDKAKEALSICVWQNGSIPPIGDSRIYENITVSKNTSKSFTESGLGIIKDNETYISLICGNRGRSHKQVDDTSITFRHSETDILVDSGNYSYDKNDPIRKAIASTYGHSGIFPDFIEGIAPQSYPQQGTTFSITTIEGDEFVEKISCEVKYTHKNLTIKRELIYIKPDKLIVKDEIYNPNKYNITDRWLFGPNFKSINNNQNSTLTLTNSNSNEGVKSITVSRHALQQQKELHIGSMQPIHRGWYSTEPNVAIPIIEISHTSNESIIFSTTTIEVHKSTASM